MKVLILGGSGMIGHQLLLNYIGKFEVMTTLRFNEEFYKQFNIFNKKNSFYNIDVTRCSTLKKIIFDFNPIVVINAIGITKQKITKNKFAYQINSKFPQKLLNLCVNKNIKLIHLSTDCVFSGEKGFYNETDTPDPDDHYGKSKFEGEIINDPNIITLRKSTIGPELKDKHGLYEWFVSEKGDIEGYKNAKFTGITTIELAKTIEKIIKHHTELNGLWHVAGPEIDKFTLLNKIKNILKKQDINILLNESFKCDRTLDDKKLRQAINYQSPSWDDMLVNMIKNK